VLEANRLNAIISLFVHARHTRLSRANIVPHHTLRRRRVGGPGARRSEEDRCRVRSLLCPSPPPHPRPHFHPRDAEHGAVALRGRRVRRLRQTFVSEIKIPDSVARARPLENVNNNKREKKTRTKHGYFSGRDFGHIFFLLFLSFYLFTFPRSLGRCLSSLRISPDNGYSERRCRCRRRRASVYVVIILSI